MRALAERSERIDSETLWRHLIEGRAYVVDEFLTPESSFLVLLDRPGESSSALSGRRLEILEQVLLGEDQKVVAIERKLSASTVATCLRQAYVRIGLSCKPSRVPLLVVALVNAAKGRGSMAGGRASQFEYEGSKFRVLSMALPEVVFDCVLSPAEEAVVRMRMHGRTHAEIAARRKTSLRTVANQVAAAFQRLGVSSRSDLMGLLIVPRSPTLTPRRPPSFQSRTSGGGSSRPAPSP